MSLINVYQRFLVDPRSAPLAPDVSLIYITSTTEVNGADAVVKQLTKQQHVVKINSEKILDVVQGASSLCVEIETSIQFISAGGVYLPNLDENFLLDRVATFPTVHIVRFNSQNQIQNVRVYWDQGSLLKQVEVIGNRARSWPIRDADKQTRLIKQAVASVPADNGVAQPAPSLPAKQEQEDREDVGASPGKKYIKDPYAADSLFELLSPGKDRAQPVRAPRAPASAQPPPREYSELFVGDDGDDNPEETPSRSRVIAPKVGAGKNYRASRIFGDDNGEEAPDATPIAPKAGAGKNFRPSRLFDDDETVAAEKPEQIAYRAHPKRYDHFELGADNSNREIKQASSRPASRQVGHWEFEDFTTPEKPRRQLRGEEVRHFGWSDDEPDLKDTPPARPRVVQPRRDAETHFQLTDVDNGEQNGARIISSFQNKGLNLYKDTLYGEQGADMQEPEKDRPIRNNRSKERPLSVVQNGPGRQKDFQSHWEVTDNVEPVQTTKTSLENQKPFPTDRQKAVKMMEASWDTYDQSPEPTKIVPPPHRRNMRKVNQKSWGFGDDEM
ncbi:hypothetical protein P175DRAFT_0527379 [Aspergillus ochraceoroseus IBT 24754]|uniref:Uncharacterized protein n=2 Tax=Aspergillus ochraceoroseus TaxID=138278 RepID=A0A2T5M5Z5_9EURO|nr:uncharacterized protein P175DRAFT_0527379 [Aspergillus ochraceoroseus IBT 24754]KKK13397.1 hypothetical protein AOCH_001633 [Aspergillus ochraceoroseus]PTU23926.1 hypothetical protein P175DRAFT_0527379 [Aspergillus ochraceoroseus IBT 24754]